MTGQEPASICPEETSEARAWEKDRATDLSHCTPGRILWSRSSKQGSGEKHRLSPAGGQGKWSGSTEEQEEMEEASEVAPPPDPADLPLA